MVRDFTQQDRSSVLAMVDMFYNSPGVLHPIPVAHFEQIYNEMCGGGSARVRGLIIEQNGEPAGFCSLSFSYSTEAGGDVVLIEELFMLPQYRGGGLGSEVFSFIHSEYSGKAARLRLEVSPSNEQAIKLYERLGFSHLPYVQMTLESF